MMKLLLAACALICVANAASIKWTGLAANNQWTSPVNWYPAQVPGPNDDVTIETGDVQVTISTGVNSLIMGTNVNGVANLTIFQSFVVAQTLNCDVNGNLFINAGTASLQGTVTVEGNFYFQSGTIGGQISISSKGAADLSGGATKNLIGAGLTNQGTIVLSGVVNFNQSSVFTNQGSIVASGFAQLIAGDTTATEFDSSAGSFAYNGGSNTLTIGVKAHFKSIEITSGNVETTGPVDFNSDVMVPSGSSIITQNQANTTFAGSVSGAGALNIGGKLTTFNNVNISAVTVTVGYVNFNGAVLANSLTINAGTTNFNAAGQVGTLNIVSGNVNFANAVNASVVDVEGGILSGAGGFSAASNASFALQGINFGTPFTLFGAMSFNAKTLIAFATGGSIEIAATAAVDVNAPLTLTGPPNSGSFINNGAVTVTSSLSDSNIGLEGQGIYVISGTITTSSTSFSAKVVSINGGSLSGQTTSLSIATIMDANSSGDVTVKVGSYSFSCPSKCKNVNAESSGQSFSISAN
jgi:hypothetical protein